MPAKKRLRDIVIVIPGITGSVLEADDRPVWDVAVGAAWGALRSRGESLQALKLGPGGSANGGIAATRLIKGPRVIPGLSKVDGYGTLTRAIGDRFDVVPGTVDSDQPANYFEFPYDWRLDNRRAANALGCLIEGALPRWREHSGAADAKVVLLCHSMGGLIARYWLEVLEGWTACRALVTLGTPFRGSPNALEFLANGYKRFVINLTDVMRSFPSVHQLLPIYRCVHARGNWQRPAETRGLPGVDPELVKDGLRFHREIESAVKRHSGDAQYVKAGYRVLPFVGTRQPTLQAAALDDDRRVTSSRDLPPHVDELLDGGDGTVPRLSAIPIELSEAYYDTFLAERHGGLQRNPTSVNDILTRIEQMQVVGLGAIREPAEAPALEHAPALAVDIDDLYLPGEPIVVRANVLDAAPAEAPEAIVERADRVADRIVRVCHPADDGWEADLRGLPSGTYRLAVECAVPAGPRLAVHDLFEVSEEPGDA